MPYKVSQKLLPLNESFSSVEKKVYAICHKDIAIQDILGQLELGLNQKEIIKALDSLVLKGFVKIDDAPKIQNEKTQNLELEEGFIEIPNSQTKKDIIELYSRLKEFLITNLSTEKAQLYIDELKTCLDIDSLNYKARRIALKLELMISSEVGKNLRVELNHELEKPIVGE